MNDERLDIIRDYYYDYFKSIPEKFRYAVIEDTIDIIPNKAHKRLYFKMLNDYDKQYSHLIKKFIYEGLNMPNTNNKVKLISIAGPVGVGKSHLLFASANLVKCYENRTVFLWRDLTYSRLNDMGVKPADFHKLLLRRGYLFIDDVKFFHDDPDSSLKRDVFSNLILELYDNETHPGVLITQNFSEDTGTVKDMWKFLLDEYVYSRLFDMSLFFVYGSGSRRGEGI